jgi:hypothetical protein
MRATCPVRLILVDLITLTIFGDVKNVCSLLHPPPPTTSSHSAPNISSTPCSQTPLIYVYSLSVRYQVSNPYITTGKIIYFYILMFNFRQEKG